jgi:hypothetical protein
MPTRRKVLGAALALPFIKLGEVTAEPVEAAEPACCINYKDISDEEMEMNRRWLKEHYSGPINRYIVDVSKSKIEYIDADGNVYERELMYDEG